MKQESLKIGQTPAIIYGEASAHAWLFVHGMGGNKTEAEPFAALTDAQVLAIDLPGHGERKDMAGFNPWTAAPELRTVMGYMRARWSAVSLRANSIGAYFSMLALSDQGPGSICPGCASIRSIGIRPRPFSMPGMTT